MTSQSYIIFFLSFDGNASHDRIWKINRQTSNKQNARTKFQLNNVERENSIHSL